MFTSSKSAISYQLSAISYQLSAISYQLSAISYQLSAKKELAQARHDCQDCRQAAHFHVVHSGGHSSATLRFSPAAPQRGRQAAHATKAEAVACVALGPVPNVALLSPRDASTWQTSCPRNGNTAVCGVLSSACPIESRSIRCATLFLWTSIMPLLAVS